MVNNKNKILEVLKEVKGTITTTELANQTKIDITNISRYTKALENEGLITRTTIQKGKLRLVNISLVETKPKIKIEDLKPPKQIIKKTPERIVKKEENIELQVNEVFWNNIAKSSDFKRLIYLITEGKTWRGTNADLDKKVEKTLTTFKLTKDPQFANVMKELEEKFKNGNFKPSQINHN